MTTLNVYNILNYSRPLFPTKPNKDGNIYCSGFSLIETLVALFILSVGILGTTTMQTSSFRGNVSAYYRTQASYIAADMIGRMTANPGGVNANLYNSMDTDDLPTDPECINAGCTALQMSQHDLREWAQYFTNVQELDEYQPVLSGGNAVLTGDGKDFTIQVSWTESYSQAAETETASINFRM